MLRDRKVSTQVRCVVVIRFLKESNVMRGHSTKLIHNISAYEAIQVSCIPTEENEGIGRIGFHGLVRR